MKAYSIGDRTDPDKGMEIVWAKNAKEARKINTDIDVDSFIDLQILRQSAFDDMENATQKELMFKQWKEGWWFFQEGCPNCETATDEEFYSWYDRTWRKKRG